MAGMNEPKRETRRVVISYYHNAGNNVEILVKEFLIPLVFSAQNAQGKLRAKVNKCSKQQLQCRKQHMKKFVPFQEGVVRAILR